MKTKQLYSWILRIAASGVFRVWLLSTCLILTATGCGKQEFVWTDRLYGHKPYNENKKGEVYVTGYYNPKTGEVLKIFVLPDAAIVSVPIKGDSGRDVDNTKDAAANSISAYYWTVEFLGIKPGEVRFEVKGRKSVTDVEMCEYLEDWRKHSDEVRSIIFNTVV